MVIFVLTKEGFEEMEPFINTGKYPVWLSGGVVEQDGIDSLISDNVDISYFDHVVDLEDKEAIAEALCTIAQHHPGERIWSESKPKI